MIFEKESLMLPEHYSFQKSKKRNWICGLLTCTTLRMQDHPETTSARVSRAVQAAPTDTAMKIITAITANDDWTLNLAFDDGQNERFDLKPLLHSEAFAALADIGHFKTIRNGGYFLEWNNEADLSADTLYIEGMPLT